MKKKSITSISNTEKSGEKDFFDNSHITYSDKVDVHDYENDPGYQALLERARNFLQKHPPPGHKSEDFY